MRLGPRLRLPILAVAFLAGGLVAPGPAHGDAPSPAAYSGAFRGVEAATGPVFFDGELGVGLAVDVRASTVLHLADLDLGYDFAHLPDADASVHRLALSAHLHPLSFFLFSADRTGAILGSVYARLGAGPALLSAEETDFVFSWHWGAGFDVPLADPDSGAGYWLGLLYNRSSHLDGGTFEDHVLQYVLLRLGYRRNGL